MNKQPLLICAISFGLGIFFQDKFDFPFWGTATILVLGIVGFLAGFFIRNFFFDRLKSAFLYNRQNEMSKMAKRNVQKILTSQR